MFLPVLLTASKAIDVYVRNEIPTSAISPCYESSLQILDGVNYVHGGDKVVVGQTRGPYSKWAPWCGLGVQINAWYWNYDNGNIATPNHVGAASGSLVQNPDNSGAGFSISENCEITKKINPCFGKGIPTWLVSTVKIGWENGRCTLVLTPNAFTNAVTPRCCNPFSPGMCKRSDMGKTNTNIKAWKGLTRLPKAPSSSGTKWTPSGGNPSGARSTTKKRGRKAGPSVCVPKPGVRSSYLDGDISWICGAGGVDCSNVPSGCWGGAKHATWVFSKYYKMKKAYGGDCNFRGDGHLTKTPKYPQCVYGAQ